jgi:hypothetical protein
MCTGSGWSVVGFGRFIAGWAASSQWGYDGKLRTRSTGAIGVFLVVQREDGVAPEPFTKIRLSLFSVPRFDRQPLTGAIADPDDSLIDFRLFGGHQGFFALTAQRYCRSAADARGSAATEAAVRLQRRVGQPRMLPMCPSRAMRRGDHAYRAQLTLLTKYFLTPPARQGLTDLVYQSQVTCSPHPLQHHQRIFTT